MKRRTRLTNKQRTAVGIRYHDHGEIAHSAEKNTISKENDNVKQDEV